MAQLQSRFEAWARRPWQPGETAHQTLFVGAVLLADEGYSEEQIFRFLRLAADRVNDRVIPDREIKSAISCAMHRDAKRDPSPKWPAFNPAYRAEVAQGFTLENLRDASPQFLYSPEEYIDALFPGGPWLCAGATEYAFETRLKSQWHGMFASMPYIVPNPMSSQWGVTVEGKQSMHTKSNTGARNYLVVEFDFGSFDEHAALLWHLSKRSPLVMAVYSGGKSLHGWFNAPEAQEAANGTLFAEAASLGADTRMWLKSQFTRIPGGLNRKTHRRQDVFYFNPQAINHHVTR